MNRRLTRRQQWRIEKIQEERAARAKNKDVSVDESSLGPEEEGLVISHFGQTLDIEREDKSIVRCFARSNMGALVTGDHVVFQPGDPMGVVTARLERSSLLERPDHYKGAKPIAANIDQVFVVIAVEPAPIDHTIDRALVTAEIQGLDAIVVLNKTDLINDENEVAIQMIVNRYRDIGYTVIETSLQDDSIEEIGDRVIGKTSIFVGQSGVGKSSIINHLFGDEIAQVGEISMANRRGRHTTTTARLYHYRDGGSLIDSPGIREFGLWNLSPKEIIEGFIDFHPFIGNCQFRDCNHSETAKGCAIQRAAQSLQILPERLQSYFRIIAECD